jgi:hypothetical protein
VARGLRSALERVAFRQAVGVYVGDHDVTVSRVALSAAGPLELSSQTEPCEPDRLAEVLEGILKPIAAGRHSFRPTVSFGVPTLRAFFATKPLKETDRDEAPNVLLHEVLRSSNVNVDDMEVDLVKAQPGKKPLALLVAARRKYLAGLLAAAGRCGVRPHRTEPAPFALVRLAAARARGPRRARTVVRVFLGEAQGVAVLVSGALPLAWRAFELPRGGEAAAVCSTAKAIQIVARFRGDVGAPDAVLVHGRPDLAEVFDAEPFREALGVASRYSPEPGYDSRSVALGLALGARQGEEAFDLSRSLKPRAPFWQLFPFGDVALQAALLVCVTLFLDAKFATARNAFARVRAETAKHRWIEKVDDAKLEKEKKELGQKVEAVRNFLGTRVLWSAYTRDASDRLPESIMMKSFVGLCELDTGNRKVRPKKSFVFQLSAPIPRGEGMPPVIDDYLGALRRDALLQRDFPQIELADLKWNQPPGGGAHALADFTVTCLPGPDKPRPKAPAGGTPAKKSPEK